MITENKVLPLFKSHYSIGRSILTLEKAGASKDTEPKSIIDIAKKNGLDKIFLVEDSMSGFLEAKTNCDKENIQLVFGLRLTVCQSKDDLSEESRKTESKYIIFAKNTQGYKSLLNIYTEANLEGFYYTPRADFNLLKKYWDNKNLLLCVPFYDSFLHKNSLYFSECVPDFSFTTPIFFEEDSSMWIDVLIKEKLEKFCSKKYDIIKARSIYYEKEEDFLSFMTFKCINNRSKLDKPEMDHFSSNKFSFEEWERQSGN